MLRSFFDSAICHLLLAIGFVAGTVTLFLRLYPAKEPVLIDLESLKGNYSVSFDKRCFGTISLNTELTDELTTIAMEGTFSLMQRSNTNVVKVHGEMNFNILGQFGNALVIFDTGDYSLRIGALGVDPIEIIIRSLQGKRSVFQKEFSIPGPITGKRKDGRFLAVEYHRMEAGEVRLPDTGIRIEKSEDKVCTNALPVDQILTKVLSALPTLPIPIEKLLQQLP